MKVLNIIGCPNKKDFNFDIHNSVKEFCNKNKVEYKFLDLYLDKFDPIDRSGEINTTNDLITSYRKRIEWADVIIITSPSNLYRLNIMTEGFLGKVITKNTLKNKKIITLLTHEKSIFSFNLSKIRLYLLLKSKVYQFFDISSIKEIDRKIYLEIVKTIMTKNITTPKKK